MDSGLLNILLVEDDQALGAEISSLLKSFGHEVTYCIDGDEAFENFCNGRHDFCIFDLMLPGIDGFTLTERVRRRDKNIPVFIISKRSHKDDKQKAFELEVDDYLVKPFELDELIWRIKAITRRLNRTENQVSEKPAIPVGSFVVDFSNQMLRNNDHSHRLTKRECEVLKMLTGRKNQLVKREEILMNLWGDVDYFHGRSLDVFISKLRRYLKDDKSLRIDNIPTVGYVLREDNP
ncbi:response regulator transcription factor [Marinilabilia rubra]|nr:response regulator transcription factor [Marinilabilia rubra]